MSDTPLEVWLERDDRLLRLRLNRPKANIVDAAMIAELQAAFEKHAEDTALRGVLLDSAGPHFSFGASVEEHLPVFAPAASCLLPERIGWSRAEDLLFSGRSVKADEAPGMGLIDHIDDDPAAAALDYFDRHLAPRLRRRHDLSQYLRCDPQSLRDVETEVSGCLCALPRCAAELQG